MEYDKKNCLTEGCNEFEYSNLKMGMLGVEGIYAKGKNYGSKGYFMDFAGANQAEAKKKFAHLKKINWIDQFTKAVAVKWSVLN